MYEQNRPRIRSALISVLIVGVIFLWWVNSIPNDDPLWFLRSFNHQADRITVYWAGETYEFLPGHPDYTAIMDAFADGIAKWESYEGSVGMDETGLTSQRNGGMMVEFFFAEPVKVHTQHLFSRARYFFVPLSGGHSYYHRVFSGLLEMPRAGVLNMDEPRYETLLEAVTQAIDKTP